jgi:glycerophosphoryl diester phosphodiesterase
MPSSPFALLERSAARAPAASRVAFLRAQPFAHRGLHGAGRIENSRAAFAEALRAGHGIECDVQLSRDGEAMLFHDAMLDRLTEETGPVSARTAAELGRIRLRGMEEGIPTLTEVLALLAGRVPLLIEIKTPGRAAARHCLAVHRAVEGYRGPFAVMSFNPEVGRWFARHAPSIVRGLVVSEEGKKGARGRLERHLALRRARPDFLAYDVRDLPSRFAAAQRARGLPLLTWTVRGRAAEAIAAAHADQPIYEVAA